MAILRGIKFTTAVAAFALFFMPWLDIRCSGKSLATQTGIQTMVGSVTLGEDGPEQRGPQDKQERLASARLVALSIVLLFFAVLLLLLALLNGNPVVDGVGSALCALALALLLTQAIQGFPAKDSIITSVSADQATNEMDMASSMVAAMMADSLEVNILPAFTITCVLLGIATLLSLVPLLRKLGA